jgi:predicted ester cyclase
MSPDEIKARGRRITDELFNQGDLSVVDELIDPGYTEYLAAEHKTVSAAELKDLITDMRRAFPDLHAHTEQQIVEGDTLVQRLTVTGTHDGVPPSGAPATGKRIRVSVVDISRIGPDGRFMQRWTLADQLAVLSQLNLLPAGSAP